MNQREKNHNEEFFGNKNLDKPLSNASKRKYRSCKK